MKGLLIKDFILVTERKKMIVLMLALTIWMHFVLYNQIFIIGYMTFFLCFLGADTVNCDEDDNGCAFLFTLPFSRKEYVAEKYLFGTLLCFTGWIFTTVLCITGMSVKAVSYDMEGVLVIAMIILAIALITMSVLLLMKFIYGNNVYKSRLAIGITILLVGMVCVTGTMLMQDAFMNGSIFKGRSPALCAGIMMSVAVAIMLFSGMLSVRIIERKEM